MAFIFLQEGSINPSCTSDIIGLPETRLRGTQVAQLRLFPPSGALRALPLQVFEIHVELRVSCISTEGVQAISAARAEGKVRAECEYLSARLPM